MSRSSHRMLSRGAPPPVPGAERLSDPAGVGGTGWLLVVKDDNALDLRITNLNSRAEALTTDKAQMERRLEAIEKRYRTQFSTLDALLADLTNTGNFLEQQMKNIPVPGASKK